MRSIRASLVWGVVGCLGMSAQAQAEGLFMSDAEGVPLSPASDAPLVMMHSPSSMSLRAGDAVQAQVLGVGWLQTYEREGAREADTQVGITGSPHVAGKHALADTGLTFGLGMGAPVWEKSSWRQGGEHRWHAIHSKMRALQVTPAMSFHIPGTQVHVGGSITATRVRHHAYYAFDYGAQLGAQAQVDDVPAEAAGNEGRVLRELRGNMARGNISLSWTPSPTLRLVASYTTPAEVSLTGDVTYYSPKNDAFQDNLGEQQEASGTLDLKLPHVARVSAMSGAPDHGMSLGVDAAFSAWMTQEEIFFEGSQAQGLGAVRQRLSQQWRPSAQVRARAASWLREERRVSAHLGFTSSAIPQESLALDFYDASRLDAGAMMEFGWRPGMRASVGYTHFLSLPREVEESARTPDAAGRYGMQHVGILSAGLLWGGAQKK